MSDAFIGDTAAQRLKLIDKDFPKVSVVIPSFNRVHVLPRAVGSVLQQTVPVHDIVIADDGSTDGTSAWVKAQIELEPRIKLVECVHGGISRARNAAIAQADGEWIAFIDSDDQWMPDKLEKQFGLLAKRPDLVAVFGGLQSPGCRPLLPRDDPSLFDLRCVNSMNAPSSALVRADALREAGGFDPNQLAIEDWDLWFRLRKIGPFGVVREPLVQMDRTSNGRLSTDLAKMKRGYEVVFARLLDGITNPRERRIISAFHRLIVADLLNQNGRPAEALRLAVSSLFQRPRPWAARLIVSCLSEILQQRRGSTFSGRVEQVRQ